MRNTSTKELKTGGGYGRIQIDPRANISLSQGVDAWVKGSGGSQTRPDVVGFQAPYIRPRVANPVRCRSVTLPLLERPTKIT